MFGNFLTSALSATKKPSANPTGASASSPPAAEGHFEAKTPAINSFPTKTCTFDKHLVIGPAGARKVIGYNYHFCGIGGESPTEERFFKRHASDPDEPVMFILPLQDKIIPPLNWGAYVPFASSDPRRNFYAHFGANIRELRKVKEFVESQSDIAMALLQKNMMGQGNPILQYWNLASKAAGAPLWHYFEFLEHLVEQEDKRRISVLKAETMPLILKCAEKVAPYADDILKRFVPADRYCTISGFSQGVGPAIALSMSLMPGRFKHMFAVAAPYIDTENNPPILDKKIGIDVFFNPCDPIMQIIGIENLYKDLEKNFPGRHRVLQIESRSGLAAGEVSRNKAGVIGPADSDDLENLHAISGDLAKALADRAKEVYRSAPGLG